MSKAKKLRENARRGSAFYRKLLLALADIHEKLAAEQQSTPSPKVTNEHKKIC